MKGWNLKIVLKSDFCTAAGESTPGIINIKTALRHGIPYIPAKRIKGCLLEAGREMADNGVISHSVLDDMFGNPGEEEGTGLHVYDGYLSFVPGYLFDQDEKGSIAVENREGLYEAMGTKSETDKIIIETMLTRVRTRTAIDGDSGTAMEHSLRTVQVVPGGVVFSCRIVGDLKFDEEKALILCVKGLRHMGLGITRGMGEIHCSLEQEEAAEYENGQAAAPEACGSEEVCLFYELDLDEPLVIANGLEDCCRQIPAGALLGAFAGMYIRKHSLKNAHEDEDFNRMFLRDGVRFGYGFLKKGERAYLPCPKALYLLKDEEKTWINVMRDESGSRRKRLNGQISFEGKELYAADVEKEIHFHHARPADRGIGHALNDRAEDTGSPAGQFFQYISLTRGQTFAGSMIGRGVDIRKLLDCLEENHFRLRLGKSRTAEYGSCSLRVVKTGLPEGIMGMPDSKGKDWFLWLLTPLVFRDPETGFYVTDTELFRRQLSESLGCDVEFEASICDYTVLDGYNSKWRLPSAACPALAAGSVFHIKTDREIDVLKMCKPRWGVKTGNGCGQVMAAVWDVIRGGELKTDSVTGPEAFQGNEKLFTRIIERREKGLEIMRAATEAIEELERSQNKLPQSSVISMFLQEYHNMNGKQEDLYGKLKEKAGRIRKEDKKKRAQGFLEPCENKSKEFIKMYLDNAKWKARRREETDD